MNDIFLILCALSALGAGGLLFKAARHAVHLEKCRGNACKPEARP